MATRGPRNKCDMLVNNFGPVKLPLLASVSLYIYWVCWNKWTPTSFAVIVFSISANRNTSVLPIEIPFDFSLKRFFTSKLVPTLNIFRILGDVIEWMLAWSQFISWPSLPHLGAFNEQKLYLHIFGDYILQDNISNKLWSENPWMKALGKHWEW